MGEDKSALSTTLKKFWEEVEDRVGPNPKNSFAWNIPEIDKSQESFCRGVSTLFAAQMFHGKTTFAAHMARNLDSQGDGVVVYVGEKKNEHFTRRLLEGSSVETLFRKYFEIEELERFFGQVKEKAAQGGVRIDGIIIDPIQRLYLGSFENRLWEMKRENEDDDIPPEDKHDIWKERVDSVGSFAHAIAKDFDCAVLYTCWMGRVEEGKNPAHAVIGDWETYIRNIYLLKKLYPEKPGVLGWDIRSAFSGRAFRAEIEIPAF